MTPQLSGDDTTEYLSLDHRMGFEAPSATSLAISCHLFAHAIGDIGDVIRELLDKTRPAKRERQTPAASSILQVVLKVDKAVGDASLHVYQARQDQNHWHESVSTSACQPSHAPLLRFRVQAFDIRRLIRVQSGKAEETWRVLCIRMWACQLRMEQLRGRKLHQQQCGRFPAVRRLTSRLRYHEAIMHGVALHRSSFRVEPLSNWPRTTSFDSGVVWAKLTPGPPALTTFGYCGGISSRLTEPVMASLRFSRFTLLPFPMVEFQLRTNYDRVHDERRDP
ncbi:hypothetical protein TgHK011_005891 [Trichoderma gracile]|nr:hypothetical protein TgHK011_005891 [Trichoderma gracile]